MNAKPTICITDIQFENQKIESRDRLLWFKVQESKEGLYLY